MDLILITPPTTGKMELPFLNQMFRRGLRTLHLRKPNWCKSEMKSFLDEICKEFHDRIVLHDHFDLAVEYGLKGVHFTERGKENFDTWKDYPGLKSWAVHDEDELLNLPEEVDYVLLSPIFQSISKPDYVGKLNMEKAVEYLNSGNITAKVFALGGVDADKFRELKFMGFDGAAILGSLWGQFEISPEDAYSHWEKMQEVCQTI